MPKLPLRYAHYAFGVVQAAITTGVATFIASLNLAGSGGSFLWDWLFAWLLSWLALLPVVIFFAPIIKRAVLAVCDTVPSAQNAEPPPGPQTLRAPR